MRQILEDIHEQDMAHFYPCKRGHHRSVAWVEILAARLRDMCPDINFVHVWHLDHTMAGGEGMNWYAVQDLARTDQERYEDEFEFPITHRGWNPPRQLMHRWLLSPILR